jgi:uncharacterized protein (DUF302 family)
MTQEIGFEVRLNQPYDVVLELTKSALMEEGFGVLTTIDIQATMKEKLDIDFRQYSIFGACNPHLGHRLLTQDAVAGLLLPCNVTVEEESGNSSIVRIVNPQVILGVGSLEQDEEISAVAREAHTKLERVAEALASA